VGVWRGHYRENYHVYIGKNLLQNRIKSNIYANIYSIWKVYQIWYKSLLHEGNSNFVQIKGQVIFKGDDNYKSAKIGWGLLNIFFSRTMRSEKLRFT
jgi:hypothetical protein